MKVTKIRIKNVMGIEQIEINAGTVTRISGKNATGKTSIIEGIKSVIDGGHDATLLRNGEKEGEVVFILDDGVEISKKIGGTASEVKVTQDGQKVSSPATLIKTLFGTGFNPVKFLTMTPAERNKEILKSIPLSLDSEKIREITGMKFDLIDYDQHGLKVLEDVRKSIYDQRTGKNAIVTNSKATKKQLETSLVDVTDVSGDIAKLEEKQRKLTGDTDKIAETYLKLKGELQEQMRTELSVIEQKYAKLIEEAGEKKQSELDAFQNEKQDIASQLSALREKEKLSYAQAESRKIIENLDKQINTAEKESFELTSAIEKIDQYKSDLISKNKIAGMSISIENNQLIIDKVPYDRLNTAKKIELAMTLAVQNMGRLKFAVLDGAEALDEDSLKLIDEFAEKNGLTLFEALVSPTPLTISGVTVSTEVPNPFDEEQEIPFEEA